MCDCLTRFNEQLQEHNVGVDGQVVWTRSDDNPDGVRTERVALKTYKLSPSKSTKPAIFPTFCPFCGERYVTAAMMEARKK